MTLGDEENVFTVRIFTPKCVAAGKCYGDWDCVNRDLQGPFIEGISMALRYEGK